MQEMRALRQFPQGICLSQRTFLLLQVTQDLGFRVEEGSTLGSMTVAPEAEWLMPGMDPAMAAPGASRGVELAGVLEES